MNLSIPLLSKLVLLILTLSVLLVLACGSDPTPTPEPTDTPLPESTAMAAPTTMPEPTAIPAPTSTSEPTVTPTPLPTATPTLDPTVEPAPTAEATTDVPSTAWQPGASLLPEGASMVIDGYPSAVLDPPSPFITAVLGLLGAPGDGGIDDALEAFQEGTGIDMLSVEYAEMFMDIDTLLGAGSELDLDLEEQELGVALYGEFDEDEIFASFERVEDVEVDVSDYQGFTVYRIGDVGGDPMTISIVDSGTVLFGTHSGVSAMLNVAAGAAPPLAGELREALNALGNRHIGVAMALTPDYFDELTIAGEGEDAVPQMGLLGALDMSAITAPVSGIKLLFNDDAVELESISFYEDSASATAAKEYSEGLTAMVGMMLASSPELQEFASGMEIGISGEVVTFSIRITVEAIEQLLDTLGAGMMPLQN